MHAWKQIQITLDYIEEHLSEPIEISTLAALASLSPFYYQRLFSRLVKKPPMEYIRLRRMARATKELLRQDCRILDVALDLGFSSHEQFTRTFKETFGMTPEEYRRNPVALNYMTKPELLLHYTLIDEDVPLITEGIVLEVGRRTLQTAEHFIGLKQDAPIAWMDGLGTASGVDPLYVLWERFHARKRELPQLLPGGDELGITFPSAKEGCFSYFAGAQATEAAEESDLIHWEVPAGEYIVCSFEAESFDALVMDALYKALQYLFQIWLPKHGLLTEPYSMERYRSHSKDITSMEVWIRPIPAN